MISPLSFLNGISALLLVCSAGVLFFISLFLYSKHNLPSLLNLSILFLANAFGWMGISISFLSTLLTGENLPWVKPIISFFSYIPTPIGVFTIVYVVWNLLGAPYNKKAFLRGALTFAIVYYIILFAMFPINIVCPAVPAGEIYDDWINPFSILYYLYWSQVIYAAILTSIGFSKLGKLTSGDSKKRALMLILASGILSVTILADTVILGSIPIGFDHTILLSIPRFGMIIGLIVIFFAFKPNKT